MSPTHQDLSNDTTFSQIKSRVPVPLRTSTNNLGRVLWAGGSNGGGPCGEGVTAVRAVQAIGAPIMQ